MDIDVPCDHVISNYRCDGHSKDDTPGYHSHVLPNGEHLIWHDVFSNASPIEPAG